MRKLIATTVCCEPGCGGTMEGRKGGYRYVESGLQSVVLKDILVFHCPKCNAVVPEIPAVGILHRVIALKLILKRTFLTGDEMRFLRKFLGHSVNEFAEILGSSKSVVCRWETDKHGAGTDRIVRLMTLAKLVRELAGQPEQVLRRVTIETLSSQLEAAFKLIEARKDKEKEENYEISPEEIAQFAGSPRAVEESLELEAAVN